MAQLEFTGGKPIKINWGIPRIDVVVEYNNYSVAEEVPESTPVFVVEEEGEEIYRSPNIVEIEKSVVGDDVNSDELVDHYGFPVPDMESIRTIDLKNYVDGFRLEKMLAVFDEGELLKEGNVDHVSIGKSSNKKNAFLSKEMTFIDYSKRQRVSPKFKKDKAIARLSSNLLSQVQKVVERKIGKDPLPPPTPLLALASDFAKKKFFQRTLRAHSAVGGHRIEFQFISDYGNEEIFYSDEKGMVDIFPEKRLGEGVLRGRLVSSGHIRTVVNLPILASKGESFDIPLIDEETFAKYREKGEELYGGFLLVRLSEKVEDVDVGNDYSFRIYLDEEFREISPEDGYSYILFMGIQAGVNIMSCLLEDGRIAEKPVHVSVDEILYDFSPVEKARHETFELYQKNLFSSERRELVLGERKIRYFNRDLFPTKKGLNYYEIKKPPVLEGARNYLKLEHLDGILYVGYGTNRKLEIPNQDFIENIIEGFDIDDLSNACLIQLNFADSVLGFGANLDSGHDFDNFDLVYLNNDGTFEKMPSLKTNKAFILGESPGVLSGRIEYSDGRWEFFKSFCSLGSYLIEQF